MMNQLLLLFVVLCMINIVESFPGGTGSCIGGQAAVGGSHLQAGKTITNTTLEEQSVTLILNTVPLTPGVRAVFEAGSEYTFELTSTTSTMKGCFIRFSVPTDVSKDILIVTPVTNTQDANVCASETTAAGVTHTNDDDKAVCSCTLELTTAASITIDVTIVIENDDEVSIYAYNQFLSGATTDSPTTSPAPIPAVEIPPAGAVPTGAVPTEGLSLSPSPSFVGTSSSPSSMMIIGGPAGILPPSISSERPVLIGGPAGVLPPSISSEGPVSDSSDVPITSSPTLTPNYVIGGPAGIVVSDPPTMLNLESSDVPTRSRGDGIMTTQPVVPTVPTAMAPAGSVPTASVPTASVPSAPVPTAPSTSSAFITSKISKMMTLMISMFVVALSTQV